MDAIMNFIQGMRFSLEPHPNNILFWIAGAIIFGILLKFFGGKKTFSFSAVMLILVLIMLKTEQFMGSAVRSEGGVFEPWIIRMIFGAIALVIFCYYCFLKD